MNIITINNARKRFSALLHSGPDSDNETCINRDCEWCHHHRCVALTIGKHHHLSVIYELPDTKTFPDDARLARNVATALKIIYRPLPLITGIDLLKTDPTFCDLEFDLIEKQGSILNFKWNLSVSNGDYMHKFTVRKSESSIIQDLLSEPEGFACFDESLTIDLNEMPSMRNYSISEVIDVNFNEQGDVQISYV